MKKVIAIFDIGKTNKKIILFDKNFELVYQNSKRFDEIIDDDNYPCDDIESIENWIQNEEARYICPECGNKVFRGVIKCNQCKTNLDLD